MSENICVINAQSGIGTASPQISQFTNNCDCVKFIINKDFTSYALIVITSIDGNVSVVSEGDALVKTYDSGTNETTVLWYPSGEITAESGCVIYQLAAYDAETQDTIWYSKEGRLIVTDSIDTTDYSTAVVGSSPNLVTQLLTLVKSLELDVTELSDTKVDKVDGMGLSSNDFTDEQKTMLENAHNDITVLINSLTNISDLTDEHSYEIASLRKIAEENAGELTYNSSSEKAQSGKAVAQAIAGIVNSAPEALDTLEELASALGDDPNFAATIMTLLGGKVDKVDGKALSENDYSNEEKQKLSDVISLSSKLNDEKAEKEDLNNHIADTSNPHGVTKAQIGLGNADNTADIDKPISTAVQKALDDLEAAAENLAEQIAGKVDKKDGFGLSSNNFTDEFIKKIEKNTSDINNLAYEVEDNVWSVINENQQRITNIEEDMYQTPLTAVPATLEANKKYNFGEQTELALAFPSEVSDGDVVYLTFKSGETATTLTINTTNTCDIEIIPEVNTGYEVFGMFNGSIWIVNYSEYTVSEG